MLRTKVFLSLSFCDQAAKLTNITFNPWPQEIDYFAISNGMCLQNTWPNSSLRPHSLCPLDWKWIHLSMICGEKVSGTMWSITGANNLLKVVNIVSLTWMRNLMKPLNCLRYSAAVFLQKMKRAKNKAPINSISSYSAHYFALREINFLSLCYFCKKKKKNLYFLQNLSGYPTHP